MKPLILFPTWARPFGLVLILTAIVFRATGWTDADWLGVLSGGDFYYLVLATGFFFVSTAREKLEDERIAYLRARAWQWAAFVFGLGFVLTCLFFTTDMVLLILPNRSGSFGSDATDIALELLNMQAVIFLALFVLRFQLYLYHDRRQSAKVEAA